MKKSKKIAIIIAVIMIFAGFSLGISATVMMGFDMQELNTLAFETNSYSVEEAFTNISVDGAECNVSLFKSEDGICKVVCYEGDKINHTVEVKDGTLSITRQDNRQWYEHIGVYWGNMDIEIYLPESEYDALYVKTLSGDIVIPEAFHFGDTEVQSTSGNVDCTASVSGNLSVKTVSGEVYVSGTDSKKVSVQSTSGDITVENVNSETEFNVEAVSGDVDLADVTCQSMIAETSSGDIGLKDLVSQEEIHIESVSGDVELYQCDAENLWIKTSSGNVSGSLLTEKIFFTNTSSGDVDVPHSSSGGKCEITTTSGDIEFE